VFGTACFRSGHQH